MARKQTADSAKTVERIVAATHRVLEHQDLDAISFRKVAREAGLSVGTVSYYFDSADALWEACLDAYYVRVQTFVLRYISGLEAARPVDETLRAAVHDSYRFALGERTNLRLVLALASRRGGLSSRHQQQRDFALRGLAERWELGASKKHLMLSFQTIIYAGTRYACSSVEERMAVTGATNARDADEAIASHLAEIAVTLLLPDRR